MSNLILSGLEFGAAPVVAQDAVEGQGLLLQGAALAVETTIVRHGTRSWKQAAASPGTNAPTWWGLNLPKDRTYYMRVPIYIGAGSVTGTTDVLSVWHVSGGLNCQLLLTTAGALDLRDTGFTSQGTVTPTRSAWHVFELAIRVNTAGNGTLEARLDGTTFATNGSASVTNGAIDQLRLGHTTAVAAGVDVYYDHVMVNNDQGADNNTWCGPTGGVVMLRPASDSAVTGSWTAGGGATTSLFDAVNNTPPIGAASPGTNASQVKNSANDTTGNYDAVMQDYVTAGVPSGAIINVVQSVANVGASAGAPVGAIRIVSNPAEGAETSIAFAGPGAAGTFPTNWITRRGPALDSPGPTLGTGPVLRLGSRSGRTSNVALADLMGVYVAFTPVTTRTSTDAVSASDAVTRVVAIPRAPSDTDSIADAVTRAAQSFVRTATDAVSCADAPTRTVGRPRATTDTVTITDAATRAALARTRATTDTVTASDAATRIVGTSRATADAVSIADAVTRNSGRPRATVDAVSIADAATRAVQGYARAGADTVTLADAVTRAAQALARTTTDVVTITDVAGRVVGFARTITDAVTISDSGTGIKVLVRTATDTVSVTDTATRAALAHVRAGTDSVTLADTPTRVANFIRATADTVTIADVAIGQAGVVSLTRTAADTVAISDTLTRTATSVRALADAVTISDAVARAPYSRTRATTDSVTIADAATNFASSSRAVADTVGLADTATGVAHHNVRPARTGLVEVGGGVAYTESGGSVRVPY